MIVFKNKKGYVIKKFCEIEDLNKYLYDRTDLFLTDFLKIEKYENKKYFSPFSPGKVAGFSFSKSSGNFTDFSNTEHILTWSNPFNLVKSYIYYKDNGEVLGEWEFSKGSYERNKKYIIKARIAIEEWLSDIFTKEGGYKEEPKETW